MRNPFAAKVHNPFAANPLTTADAVTLLDAPPQAQELEPRMPLKAFLTKGGGGGLDGLLDALGGGPGKRRGGAAPAQESKGDADLAEADPLETPEQPPPPPPGAENAPTRWGRK
jgi:hypothetical protein